MDGQTLILIVDDAPGMFQLFKDLFEDERGYSVHHAPIQTMTIEAVRKQAPDLILFDSQAWPPIFVQPFVQTIRSDPATARVPIVVCSAALNIIDNLVPFCHSHDVRCLAKPFDLDDLLRIVESALRLGSEQQSADA